MCISESEYMLFKVLLSHSADLHIRDNDDNTPFHYLFQYGKNPNNIERILDKYLNEVNDTDYDIDATNKNRQTGLL